MIERAHEIAGLADDDHELIQVSGTNKPDIIITGGGPQHIVSFNGSDTVSAGGGPDIVEAGNGEDAILGGGGPDMLLGGNGNDLISGDGGPDQLFGGNGDDMLDGGASFDTLTGGNGADVFVFSVHTEGEGGGMVGVQSEDGGSEGGDSGRPAETITDFTPGVDTIDFSRLIDVDTISAGPAEYAVWFEQNGENTMVYADTNGDLSGEHAAELYVVLLGVQASSLTAGDFIL